MSRCAGSAGGQRRRWRRGFRPAREAALIAAPPDTRPEGIAACAPIPVPLSDHLGFLGAPGCCLRTTLDLLNAWLVAGATHSYSFLVPTTPSLVNVHLYTQAAVMQPGVNQLLGGTITSNGIDGKFGNL